MNKLEKRHQLHQQTLDILVERLKKKYPDKTIHREVEYYEGDHIVGETDVLRRVGVNKYVWYEVKSQGALNKTQRQFNRFKRYHPQYEVKGVYVTPTEVRRLR